MNAGGGGGGSGVFLKKLSPASCGTLAPLLSANLVSFIGIGVDPRSRTRKVIVTSVPLPLLAVSGASRVKLNHTLPCVTLKSFLISHFGTNWLPGSSCGSKKCPAGLTDFVQVRIVRL